MRYPAVLFCVIALAGCGTRADVLVQPSDPSVAIATTIGSTAPPSAGTTPTTIVSPNTCAGCGVPELVPSPDLGVVSDPDTLIAALVASGPLDNEQADAVASGRAPNESICASIVETNEPTAGTVVHQADATLNGQTGVVLVFERSDGGREVRMYGTHEADPVTGGCPLLIEAPL
jgi:hypothetical protein